MLTLLYCVIVWIICIPISYWAICAYNAMRPIRDNKPGEFLEVSKLSVLGPLPLLLYAWFFLCVGLINGIEMVWRWIRHVARVIANRSNTGNRALLWLFARLQELRN
jgi:hypothetical protein